MARILNPANLLSLARVPLAFGFLFAFRLDSRPALAAALGLLLVSEATDFADGRVARALGCVSDFGKLVDPFCDSFSRLTVFLAIAAAGLAPLWMTVVLLLRDLAVAFLRTVASAQGVVIAARTSGKVKAFVQGPVAIAIAALALVAPEAARRAGPGLMLAATLVTIYSLVDYFAGNRAVLRALR
jgi:CDP-diacylglycerol--glycerol-3-phosphate 3-phosphatidyltransferase